MSMTSYCIMIRCEGRVVMRINEMPLAEGGTRPRPHIDAGMRGTVDCV